MAETGEEPRGSSSMLLNGHMKPQGLEPGKDASSAYVPVRRRGLGDTRAHGGLKPCRTGLAAYPEAPPFSWLDTGNAGGKVAARDLRIRRDLPEPARLVGRTRRFAVSRNAISDLMNRPVKPTVRHSVMAMHGDQISMKITTDS
jgi:hypothetical protein